MSSTPRERWGTCCPFDPECEHSLLSDAELERWMDASLTHLATLAIAAEAGCPECNWAGIVPLTGRDSFDACDTCLP